MRVDSWGEINQREQGEGEEKNVKIEAFFFFNWGIVALQWARSLGQEDPLEKEWLPTQVFFPRESMDRGAWWATVYGGWKESDTPE